MMPFGSDGSSQETRISEELRARRTGGGMFMGTVREEVRNVNIIIESENISRAISMVIDRVGYAKPGYGKPGYNTVQLLVL